MKKMIFILAGLVLLLAARVYAYDDGDFQIWNTNIEEFRVNKNLKVALEEEFRWADNAQEFFYQHYDFGLSYIMNKYWSLGGGYRHIYELSKNKFKLENEPYLTATLTLTGAGLIFDSRSRFEYRHFDYKSDSGRYRNKFTLKYPLKISKFEIQPFISDEVFLSFVRKDQFNQNRFSCGTGINITKNIKAEIYYMLVTAISSGKWVDSNVLGTKFKIVF